MLLRINTHLAIKHTLPSFNYSLNFIDLWLSNIMELATLDKNYIAM